MNLHDLFDRGDYRKTIELATELATPEALIMGAQAAITLAEYHLAEELLHFEQPLPAPELAAERLTLLGVLHYYRGEVDLFRQLTLQAAQLAPTFVTLYYLSRSRPPREGILLLQEALHLASRSAQKNRVTFAMASNYARLGRYREALSHASLASLRNPDPNYFLIWAQYALYGSDDIPLERLIDQLTLYRQHEAQGIRLDATTYLAEMYLIAGQLQQARELFEEALPQLDASQLPFAALIGLHIYQTLGETEKAYQLALATQVAAPLSQLHRGVAALVMGQALFPDPQARSWLEETCLLLFEESPMEVLKAEVYLAALEQKPLSAELTLQLEQWSWRARSTFPQPTLQVAQPYSQLRVLGQANLTGPTGPITLRPRSLELLILMLAHPDGLDRESLSELLYGRYTPRALYTELVRLRSSLGGGITANPWRITLPVWADFIELGHHLRQGDLAGAVALYRGPLLPRSRAPGIENLRHTLEEELRLAVLACNDYGLLYQLCERLPDDLELWENLLERTPGHNPRHPAVLARVTRLQREYKLH